MSRRSGSMAVAAVVAGACALLAGCGGSSSSATTTTMHATTTTTTTPTPPLTSAQKNQLQPKVLIAADFPSGWTGSTAPSAVNPAGAPPCVANLVTAKGSAFRASAAFVSPATNPAAVIQTVASFPPGTAASATASLDAGFLACNGSSLALGQGQTAKLTTSTLDIGAAGSGGFTAQMTLTDGKRHEYVYMVTGTKGDLGTLVVWQSVGQDKTAFATTAAKALARL
jgi:hypothetical protein